jgi:multidrug resistance efflux pump
MKNISFKRKESLIRGSEIEAKKKTSRFNWDRLIYFVLLFVLLFFLMRYFVFNYLYLEANGQILFDSIDIRNTDDCRVIKFYKNEGDSVSIGDSLFSYIPDEPEGAFNAYGTYEFAMSQKKEGDVSWAEREIFKAQEEVKLNKHLIDEKQKLIAILERDLERIRNEVMLDVLPRYKLDEQQAKITQLNYDISNLKATNKLLNASLGQLNGMKRNLGSKGDASGKNAGNGFGAFGDNSVSKIFYSPLEGTITNILKNEYEVALKEEVIITIHRPKNVYIKGFFKQVDLKYLHLNDTVELDFPDGSVGKGYIKRFYFATYQLPDEFQKKYEPTTRSLSADIYPINLEELDRWKKYWKMGVIIKKFKY